MLTPQERVARQEQTGKTVFDAIKSVARSVKRQETLVSRIEREVIYTHNN